MCTKNTGRSLMPDRDCVLVAAGGTGGHLFPAESLADALARCNVPVELATDDRAVKYGAKFRARAMHAIPAATPTGGGIASKLSAALVLARGTIAALGVVRRVRPMAVVGFGGYPTVPPVLAGVLLGVPTILHEQNAVVGRNRQQLSQVLLRSLQDRHEFRAAMAHFRHRHAAAAPVQHFCCGLLQHLLRKRCRAGGEIERVFSFHRNTSMQSCVLFHFAEYLTQL